MGICKEIEIKTQERGYGYTDKKVCAGCIGDSYISAQISRKHPTRKRGKCSFCNKDRNVLPLMVILETSSCEKPS